MRRLKRQTKTQSIQVGRGSARRSVELCIPIQEGHGIKEELAKPFVNGCERSVLALIGLSRTSELDRVLVRGLIPIPDDAYFDTGGGSAWSPLVTGQALSQGMQTRAGLLLIHSHPGSETPRLSLTDRESFDLLLPRCIDLLPSWPHGSVVLGDDRAVGGRIWLPGDHPDWVRDVTKVTWLGSPLIQRPTPLDLRSPSPRIFSRQVLLIGREGQNLVRRTTVGIIGLGGGGSHIVQQAAHMGFGRLVLIDPDRVEQTNLSRLIGAGPADVGRLKTDVMSDLVRRINPGVAVVPCAERLPTSASIELAKTCTFLVSAVDSYTARNEVLKVAWRHLLPMIDIGFGATVRDGGASRLVESAAGHVHTYIPGGPCVWCSDLVSEEKLEEERAGQAVPYVEGVAAPQVVHFNGLLASQAMVEAMQLVTGFLPVADRTGFLVYRAITGELVRSAPERRQGCPTCGGELGAGDTVW